MLPLGRDKSLFPGNFAIPSAGTLKVATNWLILILLVATYSSLFLTRIAHSEQPSVDGLWLECSSKLTCWQCKGPKDEDLNLNDASIQISLFILMLDESFIGVQVFGWEAPEELLERYAQQGEKYWFRIGERFEAHINRNTGNFWYSKPFLSNTRGGKLDWFIKGLCTKRSKKF